MHYIDFILELARIRYFTNKIESKIRDKFKRKIF